MSVHFDVALDATLVSHRLTSVRPNDLMFPRRTVILSVLRDPLECSTLTSASLSVT